MFRRLRHREDRHDGVWLLQHLGQTACLRRLLPVWLLIRSYELFALVSVRSTQMPVRDRKKLHRLRRLLLLSLVHQDQSCLLLHFFEPLHLGL